MRLSDIVSAAGLAGYAEVALVLFFVVFLAIAARLLFGRPDASWEAARRLPLEDDAPAPGGAPEAALRREGGLP